MQHQINTNILSLLFMLLANINYLQNIVVGSQLKNASLTLICSTIFRICGSKPMSNMRSASSST
ncbi:hypothetical protein J437_LFUL007455, partial [Ladona fulva]